MRRRPICITCKQDEVEGIDDWESSQCIRCNDRDINRANNSREWAYYHPGEPCPPCELDKVR